MRLALRRSLGTLAPRNLVDLTMKFVLFCTLIAFWHAAVRRYAFDDQTTPFKEMSIEAFCAGAPFVFIFLVGSWHQVTAIRALTDRAYFDPLSKVLNRQTFVNRFRRAMPRARSGILLLLDGDNFKRINDLYGHAMGDRCIEAIGHRLNWNLRDKDLAGRIGGEEFAVFIPDVTEEHARSVATRLGMPISFSDRGAQVHLTVTLSIGATFVDSERSFEEHLIDADNALYTAKNAGRAQLRFHNRPEAIPLSQSCLVGLSSDSNAPLRSHSKMNSIADG